MVLLNLNYPEVWLESSFKSHSPCFYTYLYITFKNRLSWFNRHVSQDIGLAVVTEIKGTRCLEIFVLVIGTLLGTQAPYILLLCYLQDIDLMCTNEDYHSYIPVGRERGGHVPFFDLEVVPVIYLAAFQPELSHITTYSRKTGEEVQNVILHIAKITIIMEE